MNEVGEMFITFEGADGSGKSTHVRLLSQALQERGYDVVETREPGGSALGEDIRALLQDHDMHSISEVLLFWAARYEHYQRIIYPALCDGKIVLCDRFFDSTLAYQGVLRGVDVSFLKSLQKLILGDVEPDLTLILDADTDDIVGRLTQRQKDQQRGDQNKYEKQKNVQQKDEKQRDVSLRRFDQMVLRDYASVQSCYMSIAQQNPHRCRVISPGSVEDVHSRIMDIVLSAMDINS